MKNKSIISKAEKKIIIRPTWKRLLILTMAALLFAFATRYFIVAANLYSPGMSGIAQGATYTLWDAASIDGMLLGLDEEGFKNIFIWVFNLALNIPIVGYSLFKYGRRYTGYSLYTFTMSATFSLFFTFAPGFSDSGFINMPPDSTEQIRLVLSTTSALFGGILAGSATGVIFSQSASSLGLDPVTRTISREKGVDLKKILFTFSIINSIIWAITSEGVLGNIDSWLGFLNASLFNIKVLSSFVFLAIFATTAAIVYPSSNKFSIKIITKKADLITKKLKEVNFHRPQTLYDATGGYTGSKQKVVEIILFNEEIYDLMKYINDTDENAFITAEPIKQVFSAKTSKQTWKVWTNDDAENSQDAKKLREKVNRFWTKKK